MLDKPKKPAKRQKIDDSKTFDTLKDSLQQNDAVLEALAREESTSESEDEDKDRDKEKVEDRYDHESVKLVTTSGADSGDNSGAHSNSDSGSELDAEDNWESVELDILNTNKPSDIVSVTFEDRNKQLRRQRRVAAAKALQTKDAKKKQLTLHICHTQCLIMHAKTINRWLCKQRLVNALKKAVPTDIRKEAKKYHRRVANGTLKGKSHALTFDQLILLLVKWWRKQFKVVASRSSPAGSANRSDPFIGSRKLLDDEKTGMKMYISSALKFTGTVEVGGQLFVAVLRALGFDTRLVYSPPVVDYDIRERHSGTIPDLYLFPLFWAEVYDDSRARYVSVDPFVLVNPIHPEKCPAAAFEPHGPEAGNMKMHYVICFDYKNSIRDLTPKYKAAERLTRSLSGFRDSAAAKAYGSYLYFLERFCSRIKDHDTIPDFLRNESKMLKRRMELAGIPRVFPNNVAGYKKYPALVLESQLPKTHAVSPGSPSLYEFADPKTGNCERVYLCSSIVICRSKQSWIKDARVVKADEKPLRQVDARALTINGQRRVLELTLDDDREGHIYTDLYCYNQTVPYVATPVTDSGVLPKNEYGSIFMFRPEMIPSGAKHMLHPGIETTAKNLGVNFAPALVSFEFRRKNAYPVHKGIVIASQNESKLLEAWRLDYRQRILELSRKKCLKALNRWRLYVRRLHLLQDLKRKYG